MYSNKLCSDWCGKVSCVASGVVVSGVVVSGVVVSVLSGVAHSG